MSNKYLAVLSLLVAVALNGLFGPVPLDTATAGIPGCNCTAWGDGGYYFVCPSGDGDRFDDIGAIITVEVKDLADIPIAGIPATDFWLIGCNDNLLLIGGSHSIDADSVTGANGQTTISGTMSAGGCDEGLAVIVQGVIIETPDGLAILCLPYTVRSPDMNGANGEGDGIVDLLDLSIFAMNYLSPPKPYVTCVDFNGDGSVDLIDFSKFGQHYQH
jgi:hypothetical protein